MDHMWKIALKACNTDVSMAAIQYINSYYMGQNLQHENEFVCQCMTHLKAASEDLTSNSGKEEASLLCIQRALLLMKTHIETFRRRYAYHLRKWALEGKGIGSHSATLGDRSTTPVRLIIQSGTSTERCYLDLLSTDYIADLRAEIVKWCEGLQQGKNDDDGRTPATTKGGDIWIRIITQGQEITIDCDEKTLGEMGFKDNQMIYISAGMSRSAAKRRECSDAPSLQPAPPRDSLPTLLLLRPNYFEQLFSLMHGLSSMKIQIKGGRHLPHTKAQVLSRRVWDILSLLPTSPKLLQGFRQLDVPLSELLDPSSAQKLMYSLYIVESLSVRPSNQGKCSEEEDSEPWQDCLASLLKILCQLGVEPLSPEMRPTRIEKIVIPNLNEALLALIEVKSTMTQLTSILEEASMPKDPNQYKTGFWGRSQVVHYAMALLVSWLHCREEARLQLFQSPNFADWLRRLASEEGKEPYGPACRDYFWLVSRLVDSLPDDLVKESIEDPQNCVIDLNALTEQIARSVLTREYLETRHRTVDDDGLIGLLNLLTNLLKHRPPFQSGKGGQELLVQVFDALFALPTPRLRHVPKCKSPRSRTAAFDLLVELVKGSPANYEILREKLLQQHQPGPHSPYPWDYWPHEDGRSECGYVGATCYMASCMQHLYMMPQARASILSANTEHAKHEPTLKELQRMFAYLLESERKAYNPRSFCKVYTMDHQPLNTAEQKDMAEFFIDLVSKLEEMTPALKEVIKKLFCGVISNNVVSLDCDHVSRTLEEFYTCGKKVRAEKRACFKKLPHILCFNTMRYTFNMLTMLKEKVNTHFSFPLRLNMAGYVEKQLMPQQYQEEKLKGVEGEDEFEQYEYDLIGVELSKELEDWIWQDNMHFIQDKNIFEHTYFNFMWQVCGYIPQTILPADPDVTQKAAQLSTSFFIETFIHAKEKPTMVQWVELVTKQFNACQEACVWFLEHMAQDTWWPVQRLKQSQASLYVDLEADAPATTAPSTAASGSSDSNKNDKKQTTDAAAKIGNASCVTKFVKTLLSLMEHGAKAHLKHLTEYFGFLYEFSKMGEEESKFLLAIGIV
nr:unnamed protein product [Callosobruchus analis]